MAVGSILRKAAIWAGITVAVLITIVFVYGAAALISVQFPSKGPALAKGPADPPVFICEAPFHTDIALPLDDPDGSWRETFAGHLPDWLPGDIYLLFGWGDSVFFTRVMEPADLTPGRAITALLGLNRVAVRVVPVYGEDVRETCLPLGGGTEARAQLGAEIRKSFALTPDGALKRLSTPVEGELLIAAKGRYSPFNTCNQWTARVLGRAGFPRAAFAPFAFSVLDPLQTDNETP